MIFFKVMGDDEREKGTFEDLPSNKIITNAPFKDFSSEKSLQDCDLCAPVENSEIHTFIEEKGSCGSQKEFGDCAKT